MSEAIAFALIYSTAAAVALLAAGPPWRRAAALTLATALLPLPFYMPTHVAVLRGIAAIACAWALFRALDLCRMRGPGLPWAHRVWHMLAIYDTRRVRRVPPGVDRRSLLRAAGYALLSAIGVHLALGVAPGLAHQPLRWLVRWLGGTIAIYSMVDAVIGLLYFLNRLAGLLPPPVHDAPILSRSVQEFWSQRWNLVVSDWLRAHCLRPLLRRGWPRLGLLWAFAVSALLHAYFIWAALGMRPALLAGAFFLLQYPLVMAERALGVRRWPAPAARAFTVGLLLLGAPLYVEPAVQLVAPLFQR